jgi:hypothetical protein
VLSDVSNDRQALGSAYGNAREHRVHAPDGHWQTPGHLLGESVLSLEVMQETYESRHDEQRTRIHADFVPPFQKTVHFGTNLGETAPV